MSSPPPRWRSTRGPSLGTCSPASHGASRVFIASLRPAPEVGHGPGNRAKSSEMIPRYSPADFQELWSISTRYQTWLEVELAACEAMEQEKLVPAGTAASIRAKKTALDPS